MRKSNVEGLLKSFRESRKQVTTVDYKRSNHRSEQNRHEPKEDPYRAFLYKYERLELTIDSFTTRDLMYFFREKAKENGVNYIIANLKRDLSVFKRLLSNYNVREICLMIEFLFTSNQNYLEKTTVQPTLLISTWCNTIYQDSLLWADDRYHPKVKNAQREWGKETETDTAEINSWE